MATDLEVLYISAETLSIVVQELTRAANELVDDSIETPPGFMEGVTAAIGCVRLMMVEVEVGLANAQMEGL